MHSHAPRKTICAHFDSNGEPIMGSAICCCCEDYAGNRLESWIRATAYEEYDGGSRQDIPSGRCSFCAKIIGKRSAGKPKTTA